MKIHFNTSLLKSNQKCIINTDLDGVLTGLVLQNYLNWEIVGFCDSKDTIWLEKTQTNNISELIFLDIFVANPNLKCIDQHIIAKDLDHANKLSRNSFKQNPNLQRIRYASKNIKDRSAYAWKYPYNTYYCMFRSIRL